MLMSPANSSREQTSPAETAVELARGKLVSAVTEFRRGGSTEDVLRGAIRDYVSVLKQSGLAPECMLVRVKHAIAALQAPGDDRNSRRNQATAVHLIEWCIEEYYGPSQ